jgi:hypothetical protein
MLLFELQRLILFVKISWVVEKLKYSWSQGTLKRLLLSPGKNQRCALHLGCQSVTNVPQYRPTKFTNSYASSSDVR